MKACPEEQMTIDPDFCFFIYLAAALQHRKVPVKLAAIIASQSALVVSSMGLLIWTAALAKRMSILPNFSAALAKLASTWSSKPISVFKYRALPPSAWISAAVSAPAFSVRLRITTCSPSRAKSFAVAFPIPELPPVMTTTRLLTIDLLSGRTGGVCMRGSLLFSGWRRSNSLQRKAGWRLEPLGSDAGRQYAFLFHHLAYLSNRVLRNFVVRTSGCPDRTVRCAHGDAKPRFVLRPHIQCPPEPQQALMDFSCIRVIPISY